VPREIVSPGVVQVIVQENRWKQTELERPAGLELLDDLPRAEVLFMRVGTDQVEVELVGKGFGEEVAPTVERFQVKELIFDEAVNGFHIALEGVSGGRDANVLAVA
jgi:tartrate dehydratase alpha subunit/fumarate hydratase class I-like protein